MKWTENEKYLPSTINNTTNNGNISLGMRKQQGSLNTMNSRPLLWLVSIPLWVALIAGIGKPSSIEQQPHSEQMPVVEQARSITKPGAQYVGYELDPTSTPESYPSPNQTPAPIRIDGSGSSNPDLVASGIVLLIIIIGGVLWGSRHRKID